MNDITMRLNADNLIKMALQEDISSEDVTTNAVIVEAENGRGTVHLSSRTELLPDWVCLSVFSSFWMRQQKWNFTQKTVMR